MGGPTSKDADFKDFIFKVLPLQILKILFLKFYLFFLGEDCWEGSDESGPVRQIIMPKSAVDFVDGSHSKTTLMAATLPPYNKAEAPVSH